MGEFIKINMLKYSQENTNSSQSVPMKYIITSIQLNGLVNKNLLTNMLNFAKANNVDKILTFTQSGRYKEEDKISPLIFENNIELISNEMKLNENLKLYDSKILPQQINPFTGMNKKLSRDYSYILPSPKIRYDSIASNSKYPRAFMSTGSLTKPNYKEHTAHGRKAVEQHQYGFIYVEILNKQIFVAHQIESTIKGDFQYLTKKYSDNKITETKPEALILGDWHTGDTDTWVRNETFKMISDLKPKRVVFHDLFNGHSINHHERGLLLAELRNLRDNKICLQDELKVVYNDIWSFAKRYPNINFIVVRSNHDDFLEKYIQQKMFIDDPKNFLFTCSIISRIINEKKVPLQEALLLIGELPNNFKFTQQDYSLRVYGIELANHGHLGANGSRGTPNQFNNLNLKMITGHTHSPKLMENGMVVGTSTRLKLSYTHGASSWLNAHGILYNNGKYGLLTLIRG